MVLAAVMASTPTTVEATTPPFEVSSSVSSHSSSSSHDNVVISPITTVSIGSPEIDVNWSNKEYVKARITHYAALYDVDAGQMITMALCESGLNIKAFNGSDPHGGAHGVFQYLKPTFYGFAKEFGFADPDIWNPEQQMELTAWMVSEGKARHWVCARKHHLFDL